MNWYAAHIISYVKFTDANQDKYPIWENVVLIHADSVDDAYEMAENIGKSDYHGSQLSWEGREGTWEFAGVRKLIECQDVPSKMVERQNSENRPGHGTEITFLQMELDNQDDLLKLVQGDPVTVLYEE